MAKTAKKFNVTVSLEYEGVTFYVKPIDGADGGQGVPENPWDAALNAPPEPVQPPFDHRELFVMELLSKLGVGEKVHCGTIRSFGPSTKRKLEERGYIEVTSAPEQPYRDREISLTHAGLADWRALERYKTRYRGLQRLPDDFAL
ncbi:hypothetical protein [Shinella kummerowiae]|uniref:hypothetical protein n=1 Tax=Shinella kummerowiae TaxID=417745 RepID=UPI0021B4E941|nr:hypothetical protein [Shinella kummerowiae]MCT7665639.1 hypothetical protein [Shinella kummerowiae]